MSADDAPRILVIEDDPAIAELLERGLGAEGFEVTTRGDGASGLAAAQETPHFDAIITDLLVPHINGWKLCQILRAEHNWTPVLVLTGKDGEYDETESLECGADDYLVKPPSFNVLCARIRALCRRDDQTRRNRIVVADLELDPSTRGCWKAGLPVTLTAREFAVAELLARNAGRVVPKEQIRTLIWGEDSNPNVVEVYIGYLRKKLDEPFASNMVKTVRGIGYLITAG